ncbi:MAG: MarC family protein [Candidatus Diapherotrites archaeon]
MALIEFFVSVLVSLFVVVDVIANVPIFIALTERYTKKERNSIAFKAMLIAFIVLMLMVFAGQQIFDYLKINLYSFQIAGGIILFIIAIEMLFGFKTRTEYSEKELEEEKENITVTPLAVPLHTGPAAITTGIVFFNSANTTELQVAFVIAAIAVYVISLIILLKSEILLKVFKSVGLKVFSRIMGLILASIAVQFVVDGIKHAIIL